MNLLLAAVTLLVFYAAKFFYSNFWVPWRTERHFKRQGIGGPGYRPIFGNTSEIRRLYAEAKSEASASPPPFHHDIMGRVAPFYDRWSRAYGKTFLYWFGSTPRLAVTEPDMIKEVLMNTRGEYVKVPFNPQSKMLFGQGLVGLEGDQWAFHRSIINLAFNFGTC